MSRARVGLAPIGIILLIVLLASLGRRPVEGDAPLPAVVLGDAPAIREHLDQDRIDHGDISLTTLLQMGRALFVASFNTLDGLGRPEATGSDVPTTRPRRGFPENFNRASGPEANSCVGCHNLPRPGGGGDNAANAFVLAENHEFTQDISPATGNERNTMGMWGSGAIEMLAREMSLDLQAIRQAAREQAKRSGQAVTLPLVTKGVEFGKLTAHPDGRTDESGVEGVDRDLVIKPFHQKGVVPSIRQFTVNAFNHHHGMQASERFGDGVDFDKDGVADELTRGDITAITLFQAAMEVPGQVIPRQPVVEQAIRKGETLFRQVGCASCHVPVLTLNSPMFTQPSPYSVASSGSFQVARRMRLPIKFDLTQQGPLPRPERTPEGKVLVRAFTDLKRHKMGPLCDNEKVVQAGVPTDQYLTKKLWGFASEPPFMHHGRATTVTEAILMHGGDAQVARERFERLEKGERDSVIAFLKSLQVLPAGSRSLMVDEAGNPR